jgi:isocitrate dehydrogenase (NAD+)
MKMVIAPERFDVIVTMNLFGDILSDLAAGLIGGLGVAGAANIGAGPEAGTDTRACAMFEAVHGTAPDIAGKGIANPTGLMMSAAMLLDHVEQRDAAARLRKGLMATLADPTLRTGDLGGKSNTDQYTDAVIRAMD